MSMLKRCAAVLAVCFVTHVLAKDLRSGSESCLAGDHADAAHCDDSLRVAATNLLQTGNRGASKADVQEEDRTAKHERSQVDEARPKRGKGSKWEIVPFTGDISGDPPCRNTRDGILHNQRPKLVPPNGSAWRGSCVGWSHDEGFIADYEARYGAQLQLYRFFSKNEITLEMRRFVKAGGILWYNIAIDDWRGAVNGAENERLDFHAARVAEFAPAQVIICLSHEPDHDVKDGRTAKDFRDMWAFVQDRFRSKGATNTVWAMDYSTGLQRAVPDVLTGTTKQWENAKKLWPGSDRVDWLFFNLFERGMDPPIGNDYWGQFAETYKMLEEATDCEVGACNFNDVAWGVGAFGTATLNLPGGVEGKGRKGKVTLDEEIKWLQQASSSMAAHPKVKAYIYFDAKQSAITEELKSTYMDYLQSDFFTANDP